MDFHHRLTRKTIDIAVTKILGDMKYNTKRSVRNLVDLGALFSGREHQKAFFADAKKVLSNPNNPYNDFAARITAQVDNAVLKTIGVNLGYSSLTYGAEKLRKNQAALGYPIPWLLAAEVRSPAPSLPALAERIDDGRELGIYSYLFRLFNAGDLLSLSRFIGRYEECFFILDTPDAFIGGAAADVVSRARNTVVNIRPSGNDPFSKTAENAFEILKKARCLYGLSVNYDDGNERDVTSPPFIRHAITCGASYIVYSPAAGASLHCRRAVYDFVRETRGENGSPIIALEWHEDVRIISERIESAAGACAPTWTNLYVTA